MLNAKQISSTRHQAADRSWVSGATATEVLASLGVMAVVLSGNSKYEGTNAKQIQSSKVQAAQP
jgi:hypothetical protein